jgi:hypothetical protein
MDERVREREEGRRKRSTEILIPYFSRHSQRRASDRLHPRIPTSKKQQPNQEQLPIKTKKQ